MSSTKYDVQSEYQRLLNNLRTYGTQMKSSQQKFQNWHNSINKENEQIRQKEELLATKEEIEASDLGLKFAQQAKEALENKQTKDFIRYKRRVDILAITKENPFEQKTQSYSLSDDSCSELAKNGVNSNKFKTFTGNQAQQLLIFETVEIIKK